MYHLSSVNFVSQPLHVSGMLIVESVVLVGLEPNQEIRQSTKNNNKYQLCICMCIYIYIYIYMGYLLLMRYKYTQNM